MDPLALFAYALTLACFLGKYLFTIGLQGHRRSSTKRFRWPEDATAFGGSSDEGDAPVVRRAQHLLRNDGESLPLFFAVGAAWIAVGATGWIVASAFALFTSFRFLHAWFMLWPKQPARVRAFTGAQLVLLGIMIDAVRLAARLALA